MFVSGFQHFKDIVDTHIKPKKTMYIGDKVSDNFIKFFGKPDYFIETPSTNSYQTIEEWYPNVLKNISNVDVAFLCSGFSSRVLSKRIWELNEKVTCLDMGSFVSALNLDFNRFWFRGGVAEAFKTSLGVLHSE